MESKIDANIFILIFLSLKMLITEGLTIPSTMVFDDRET